MFLVHFRAVSVAESCARDAAVAVPKCHVTAGIALHLPRCVPEQTSFRGPIVRPLCPERESRVSRASDTDGRFRKRPHSLAHRPQLHGKGEKKNEFAPKRGRRKLNFLAPASSLSYGRKEETRKVSLILLPATHPFPWLTCRLLTLCRFQWKTLND